MSASSDSQDHSITRSIPYVRGMVVEMSETVVHGRGFESGLD